MTHHFERKRRRCAQPTCCAKSAGAVTGRRQRAPAWPQVLEPARRDPPRRASSNASSAPVPPVLKETSISMKNGILTRASANLALVKVADHLAEGTEASTGGGEEFGEAIRNLLRWAVVAGTGRSPERSAAPGSAAAHAKDLPPLEFCARGAATRRGKFWRRQVAAQRRAATSPMSMTGRRKEGCGGAELGVPLDPTRRAR